MLEIGGIRQSAGGPPPGGDEQQTHGLGTPTSRLSRAVALCALVAAVAVVGVLFFTSSPSYTLRLYFQDSSGLVTGDEVMIGPANVGSVRSIGLSPNGEAVVRIGLHGNAAPMHQGTVARIYENSLAGIASKYIVLEPAPSQAPMIPAGGVISTQNTYSEVSLDQLFDLFDNATRNGLRGVVRGEAASIKGRAAQAHRTLLYLDPGLESTSEVTHQLSLYEPAFDGLLTDGADAMQQLASRAAELTQLIRNTEVTTGAIAGRNRALSSALQLLPAALTRSTHTFAGLDQTLDALTPLVDRSKPASRRLAAFSAALRTFSQRSIPTLKSLAQLIASPGQTGNLTTLLRQTPGLQRTAATALPQLIASMNASQSQLDYLREYTPDVVAALTDLGQASGYYDANGHYLRSQPYFSAFALSATNQLEPLPAYENRYSGLQVSHGRCPGGAVQATPDGSAPEAVPGCSTSSSPGGP
ncbi:MAG TPA: MlaD family protein [Solirubrobacteraceae bacterium]|nr:MlaD family protein [Solirubrobacteraceae bacterium]